jgi:hypothetical protein
MVFFWGQFEGLLQRLPLGRGPEKETGPATAQTLGDGKKFKGGQGDEAVDDPAAV